MHDIRTITFDLDDTLWAIGPVIERADRKLQDWYAVHYPRISEMFSAAAALELRQQVVGRYREQAHDLTFLRREVMRAMGAAAGYREFDLDAAFDVFSMARNEVSLYPDVRPALAILRQQYRLIAVTNGNASLERIGIDDLFDGYICARAAGVAKPEPRIFDLAVRAGGASAAETLHVGDHPHLDIAGAHAAGLASAWINRAGHEWPVKLVAPAITVRDLHELVALLAGARQENRPVS